MNMYMITGIKDSDKEVSVVVVAQDRNIALLELLKSLEQYSIDSQEIEAYRVKKINTTTNNPVIFMDNDYHNLGVNNA